MDNKGRVGYPSDVSDEEWAFVVPYLLLYRKDAPQREYSLRAVFNGLRYLVRTGCQWRYLPHDLPPWPVVYQQTQRWIESHCFETMVEDLRLLLREFTWECCERSTNTRLQFLLGNLRRSLAFPHCLSPHHLHPFLSACPRNCWKDARISQLRSGGWRPPMPRSE